MQILKWNFSSSSCSLLVSFSWGSFPMALIINAALVSWNSSIIFFFDVMCVMRSCFCGMINTVFFLIFFIDNLVFCQGFYQRILEGFGWFGVGCCGVWSCFGGV